MTWLASPQFLFNVLPKVTNIYFPNHPLMLYAFINGLEFNWGSSKFPFMTKFVIAEVGLLLGIVGIVYCPVG
jgi:hypothetical protein